MLSRADRDLRTRSIRRHLLQYMDAASKGLSPTAHSELAAALAELEILARLELRGEGAQDEAEAAARDVPPEAAVRGWERARSGVQRPADNTGA